MSRNSRFATTSVAGVLMGAAIAAFLAGASFASGSAGTADASRVPLLSYPPNYTVERDEPAVVRDRIAREQQKLLAVARRAQSEPATRAKGCVAGAFGTLGSPTPKVVPRILGYHVEVLVEFRRFPRSLQCRPWLLRVYVHSADRKLNFDSRFAVVGPRGRVVVSLPLFGHPPYRLDVVSETLFGRRGPTVEVALRCPGTGHRVNGCLAGPTKPGTPKRPLPLRGLTRSDLEASLDYVLEAQRRPPILRAAPRAARCRSLRMCEITYVDAAFPAMPFGFRYRISGQQVPGCWMGTYMGMVGTKPYEDAGGIDPALTACASWAR